MSQQPIGRYEILETLGKGGMGVVYRAWDPELERHVAIKLVLAWAQYDEDAMARFNREARVVAQMQHPHIVTVFDAGRTDEGLPYFVMEYLEGTDLGEILGLSGPLPATRAVRYALQTCEGLSYAHDREIVHRDIKPANLLITPDDHLKVVDFGIAKLVGSQITGSGVSMGTPLYMAPEQVAGKQVDHRADIFALGGVLYTMLAGTSPFEAPTLGAICHKIETEPPPPISELGVHVHPGLEAIIQRALEKDPEGRHQSADELAAELRKIQPALKSAEAAAMAATVVTPGPFESPTQARTEPIKRSGPLTPPSKTGRGRQAVVAVTLAALAILVALWVWPAVRGPSDATETHQTASTGGFGDETSAGQDEGEAQAPSENQEDVEDASTGGSGTPGGQPAQGGDGDPPPVAPPAGGGGTVEAPETDPLEAEPEDMAPLGGMGSTTFYPASAVERGRVNRLVSELVRGIMNKDSAAVARVFGGDVPAREWRFLARMVTDERAPRARIRYELLDVASSGDGWVLAEVHNNILFVGQPGKVPPPRVVTWTMAFRANDMGRLQLRRIQPR